MRTWENAREICFLPTVDSRRNGNPIDEKCHTCIFVLKIDFSYIWIKHGKDFAVTITICWWDKILTQYGPSSNKQPPPLIDQLQCRLHILGGFFMGGSTVASFQYYVNAVCMYTVHVTFVKCFCSRKNKTSKTVEK